MKFCWGIEILVIFLGNLFILNLGDFKYPKNFGNLKFFFLPFHPQQLPKLFRSTIAITSNLFPFCNNHHLIFSHSDLRFFNTKEIMKDANTSTSRTKPIAQNVIKLISNLCFSVFVFSVLIFTVIAITYQPPDPWLQSTPALTSLFTQSQNATFQINSSVLKTGVDLAPLLQDPPLSPPPPSTAAVTEAIIEKIECYRHQSQLHCYRHRRF